jgi:hypothetical protein
VGLIVSICRRLTGRVDRYGDAVCTPFDKGSAVDIMKIARAAGLQILLDARIGRETYHSVSGSLLSLQRFAEAVCAAQADEFAQQQEASAAHEA